jgi:hypothetical protein
MMQHVSEPFLGFNHNPDRNLKLMMWPFPLCPDQTGRYLVSISARLTPPSFKGLAFDVGMEYNSIPMLIRTSALSLRCIDHHHSGSAAVAPSL